ncbi:hypothetical protein NZK35_31825 [Stieleria sp. ICT_E10.1]|uniref:hypothetical protein n=1 Tax=Stieleria sedimenti TaxID=2976331 RepID=UPI00217F8F7B|nr:hypothetical protein [Stieleria sedimenti]MCS7471267.1 hypothetical protein [Stieleria sedimenti]
MFRSPLANEKLERPQLFVRCIVSDGWIKDEKRKGANHYGLEGPGHFGAPELLALKHLKGFKSRRVAKLSLISGSGSSDRRQSGH